MKAPVATSEHPYGFEPSELQELNQLVRLRAARDGDHPFVTYLEDGESQARRLTYAQLLARVQAVAGLLAARGLKPGDRVLIMLPSGLPFLTAFFGALGAGMTPVPVYPPARLARLQHYLRTLAAISERATCQGVILDLRLLPLVQKSLLGADRVLITSEEIEAADGDAPLQPLSPLSPAFIQFTSGTTSRPRGVVILQRHIMTQLEAYTQHLALKPGEQVVSWLPLYHDLGLIGKVMASMYARCPLVLMSPVHFLRRPMRWIEALSRYRAVHTAAPNFAYQLCVRKCAHDELRAGNIDLSALDNAGMGGESVSMATVEAFRQHFAPFGFDPTSLNPCYGLAENTLVATGHRRGHPLRSVTVSLSAFQEGRLEPPVEEEDRWTLPGNGRPMKGFAVQIRGDDGEGLPEACIGSVWVRGPSVAAGYLGDSEASRATFITEDDLRWVRTGDVGFLHEGDLHICARSKDLIIVRGRNYPPQDLEEVAGAIEGVRVGNVAAFGVGDESGSEAAVLVAELDPRLPRPEEELRREVQAAIADAFDLGLQEVVFLPRGSIPKTSSGKLQRSLVKEQWEAGTLAELEPPGRLKKGLLKTRMLLKGAAARLRRSVSRPLSGLTGTKQPRQELDERLVGAVQAVLPQADVLSPQLQLESLGLGSMERMELWARVEAAFDARIPDEELGAGQTLGDLQQVALQYQGTRTAEDAPRRTDIPEWLAEVTTGPEVEESEWEWTPPWTARPTTSVVRGVSKLLWDLTADGLEHLPEEGGYLLAGNHQSYLDGAWVLSVLPRQVRQRLVAIAYANLPGFTRFFLDQVETIPVDPRASFKPTLQAGLRTLNAGRPLLVFPEGARTHTGRIGTFQAGIGLLAHLSGRPVVPFRIRHAFDVFPRDRALPRLVGWRPQPDDQLEIRFGPPLKVERLNPAAAWKQAPHLAQRVRQAVLAL